MHVTLQVLPTTQAGLIDGTAIGIASLAIAIKGIADFAQQEVKCVYFDEVPDSVNTDPEAGPRCMFSSPRSLCFAGESAISLIFARG